MHVPFKIQYRNNLIDKKDSYLKFHVRHVGMTVIAVTVISFTPVTIAWYDLLFRRRDLKPHDTYIYLTYQGK